MVTDSSARGSGLGSWEISALSGTKPHLGSAQLNWAFYSTKKTRFVTALTEIAGPSPPHTAQFIAQPLSLQISSQKTPITALLYIMVLPHC